MKMLISILTFALLTTAHAQTYRLQKTIATPDSEVWGKYTHRWEMNAVLWLDNNTIVTGDEQGYVSWWNVQTGERTQVVQLDTIYAGVNRKPAIYFIEKPRERGDIFIVSAEGAGTSLRSHTPLYIFQKNGVRLDAKQECLGRKQPIAFRKSKRTSNQLTLVSGGQNLWQHDISNPHAMRSQRFANIGGIAIATSHDDNYLAKVYNDIQNNHVALLQWGRQTKILRKEPTAIGIQVITFNPTMSRQLVGGRKDGTVQWWENGNPVHAQIGEKTGTITDILFHPNGEFLLTAHHGGGIQLWDAERKEPISSLHQPNGSCKGIDISPNGHRLASVGSEGKIYVWHRLDFDVNRDGQINVGDLRAILNNYGKKHNADGTLRRGDVNADGIVNRKDLMIVAEKVEEIEGIPAAPMLMRYKHLQWGKVKQPR